LSLGCSLVIKDPLAVLAAEHRGSRAVTFSRAEAIEELDTLALTAFIRATSSTPNAGA
jgi:hypothetical protein